MKTLLYLCAKEEKNTPLVMYLKVGQGEAYFFNIFNENDVEMFRIIVEQNSSAHWR